MDYLFTSESVSDGHPDKVADQISDAILDSILAVDPKARVAAETLCTTGLVVLAGEISTHANQLDYEKIARGVLRDIGYTDPAFGIDCNSCDVIVKYDKQSADISRGVDNGLEQGAGDQGLMFGYATNETKDFMPAPIFFAHQLMKKQREFRKFDGSWLRPDAKSQVTMRYENGYPSTIDTIVFSTQHSPEVSHKTIEEFVIECLIKDAIPAPLLVNTKYLINPTGRFVVGGPEGDCGLTGRKIIVDTYGGSAPHGGGCFSGKDPSKVDRSGAYMCRWVAKHVVASGLASKCLIQVSYAIGVAEPTSIFVDTFGTGALSDEFISQLIINTFDFRPRAIIEQLDLLQPIYRHTASYGHFGDKNVPWEWLDQEKLRTLSWCAGAIDALNIS